MPSAILRYFEYKHLPTHLAEFSAMFHDVAHHMDETLPDGDEKATGLRKLLEAKDCFVRAALPPLKSSPPVPPGLSQADDPLLPLSTNEQLSSQPSTLVPRAAWPFPTGRHGGPWAS